MFKNSIITKVLLAVLVLVTLIGCSAIPWNSPIKEEAPQQMKDTATEQPPLNPSTNSTSKEPIGLTLFFRFAGEKYLSSDTREVKVSVTDRIEKTIVEELIKGPNPEKLELKPLFNPNVKVLSVSDNNDYLFVTLSKEFLEKPWGAPEDWEKDKKWVDEVNTTKRLAIYSIVDSLTELGRFSRVQILIAREGGAEQGERIKRGEAGFVDPKEDRNAPLEPLARNTNYILTPRNTVEAVLNAFTEKDWDTLYEYIASKDINNIAKPDSDEFINNLTAIDPTLESFLVLDENVSNNGQEAVVAVNYKIKTKDGKSVEKTDIPMKLIREKEVWKVIFPAVKSIYDIQ